MGRYIENSDFIGLSVGQLFKKSNLEQNQTLFAREKIIIHYMLLSKLWYIGQIYTLLK